MDKRATDYKEKANNKHGEELEVLHERKMKKMLMQVRREGHFGANNAWYRAKV